MATFGGTSAANHNPNKSAEVSQPPSDSVSSLTFSPKGNFLVATSWDNQVLCSTWKDEGSTVFSGGCDEQVKMWPLGGQPMAMAMHDAPVKEVAWIPKMNIPEMHDAPVNVAIWD